MTTKGIILAGGTGSRLYPLTKVTNKHLLPVGHQPMIYHAVQKLVEIDVTEILVVTGLDHMGDVVSLLGSGRAFGCEFTYKVQDQAGGIAQALGLAKQFVGLDNMVVILGDNIFEDSLKPMRDAFYLQGGGARLILKAVSDPHRFGVAVLEGERVVGIEEKPKHPTSHLAVTGIYFYDARVFELIEKCVPSGRGELEITDVNNAYIQEKACFFDEFKGWWTDAGTFESLSRANSLLETSSLIPPLSEMPV